MNREDVLKIVRESYEQGQADLIESCKEAAVEVIEVAIALERKRLEQAVEELAPVRDNPILQNKPAAFWIENFKQIVRGNT
jgi:vacuolar-type H+-ATPase subunit H